MHIIDMHTHSTFSDGTETPERIVKLAKQRRISMLALTDHDTTSGLSSFMKACRAEGMNGVCGVELSAEADFTLHILGYRFNPEDEQLNRRLQDIRDQRNSRNEKMCRKLSSQGIDINIEEVRKISGGEVVARPHMAQLLVRKGYASSIPEAFAKYVGVHGSGYVARERIPARECVELIRNAGGMAVMAHPLHTHLPEDELEKIVGKLRDYGLWGIETIYSGYGTENIFTITKMANKYGLVQTAGSDFHGANKPGREMGMQVPDTFLPWARFGIKF